MQHLPLGDASADLPDDGAAPGLVGGPVEGDDDARRYQEPENEVPVALPFTAVLGRGPGAVVALVGARASTTGWRLNLSIRLDAGGARAHGADLHDLLEGRRDGWEDRLWLGVGYADGRRATHPGSDIFGGRGPDDVVVVERGGGGGGLSWEQELWVTPLPPSGEVELVVMCRALGIEESRTVLDGAVIADAGARAEVLWPPVREEYPWGTPQPPRPPEGSWFADAGGD